MSMRVWFFQACRTSTDSTLTGLGLEIRSVRVATAPPLTAPGPSEEGRQNTSLPGKWGLTAMSMSGWVPASAVERSLFSRQSQSDTYHPASLPP